MTLTVTVIEPYNMSWSHADLNAGLLIMASTAFPNSDIEFFGDRTHIQCINEAANFESNVSWKSIKLPRKSWRPEVDAIRFFFFFCKLLRKSSRGAQRIFLICHGKVLLIPVIRLVRRLVPGLKVCMVLHVDLSERLTSDQVARWPRRCFDKRRQLSSAIPGSLRLIVLEEFIFRRLIQDFPTLTESLCFLPHPLPSINLSIDPIPISPPIVIAFPGLSTAAKGFEAFLNMANQKTPNLEFWAVGKRHTSTAQLDVELLQLKPTDQYYTQAEYLAILGRCHYICLPLTERYYSYSPSGTLMDAVALRKPLLTVRSPIVCSLWEKHGPLGYVFDSDEELVYFARSLPQRHNAASYREFQQSLSRAAAERRPEELAKRFRALST